MDALGRIFSDVSWDSGCFLPSKHHIPSPRQPTWGWSSPDFHPSWQPRVNPLLTKPPCDVPCDFACGYACCCPCDAQPAEDFVKGTPFKIPTANLYRLKEGSPASFPALLDQFLVLFLSLDSSIHSSQDTGSSSTIRCFESSEAMTISGHRLVAAICWGNHRCFPSSTCNC